eukprot:evm.model.NODE_30747_length_47682_cov_25.534710.9
MEQAQSKTKPAPPPPQQSESSGLPGTKIELSDLFGSPSGRGPPMPQPPMQQQQQQNPRPIHTQQQQQLPPEMLMMMQMQQQHLLQQHQAQQCQGPPRPPGLAGSPNGSGRPSPPHPFHMQPPPPGMPPGMMMMPPPPRGPPGPPGFLPPPGHPLYNSQPHQQQQHPNMPLPPHFPHPPPHIQQQQQQQQMMNMMGGGGPPPGPHYMLPPRSFMAMLPDYLPGAASLFEQLDKQIMVVLRDGRNLVGVLRSFDQYSNMVLEDTYERHVVDDKYGDLPLGLYLVRGDSMVMLGEVDPARESEALVKVTADEIIELLQESVEAGAKLEWDFE